MFLVILGILDIIVGVILWLFTGAAGSNIVVALGLLYVIKGFWSIIAAASEGFYFDFLGIFDLIGGVFLVLIYFGISFDFFVYFAIIMALKGLYSILMGFKG